MKKILLLLLFFAPLPCVAQRLPIYCNLATQAPCTTTANPGTGVSGDQFYQAMGKTNANFAQLYGMFGNSSHLFTAGSADAADIIGLFSGCSGTEYLGADGACHSGSGGSSAFSDLTGGTNTSAAMLVGSGASLSYTGTGTVNANEIAGTSVTGVTGSGNVVLSTSPTLVTPTLGSATASGLTLSGITGLIQCLHVNTSGVISGTGADCGPGGGSGTVNSGTSGQLAYYAGTGTAVSGATLGSGLAINSGTLSITQAINAQTGTTYTVLSTDAGKLITFDNASAVAVTLPQATSSFGSGFALTVQDLGAGLVTITPTTSTINGASTLTVPEGTGCSIVSDGTNYQVGGCTALSAQWLNAASSGTSVTPICSPGVRLTVTTVTATGNLTIATPTGCTEGQQVTLKVAYSASITYTWNAAFHANASNPGALPTSSGGSSGVDFFTFYADAANSRFDYQAGAFAF